MLEKNAYIRSKQSIIDFEDMQSSNVQNYGILSLSEEDKNLLMWSHYASSHTGFLIGIITSSDLLSKESTDTNISIIPHKVNYTEERNRKFLEGPESLLNDYFFTKSTAWSYENEWRVWVSIEKDKRYSWVKKQKRGIVKFCPESVFNVVFGACMNESDIKKYC